jgi:hypothetical protein
MNLRKGMNLELILKNENGNLVADPQSVLNRWKNFFNHTLNVHGVMMFGRWMYLQLNH